MMATVHELPSVSLLLPSFESRVVLAACLLLLLVARPGRGGGAESPPADPEDYSFLVAGHAYGAHGGTNVGLLPRFLAAVEDEPPFDFVVLTGDFVRDGTEEHYAAVLGELGGLGKPFYLVLGNHDAGARGTATLQERYGGTWYSFAVGPDLFVSLDSQRPPRAFDHEQLAFLEERLGEKDWRNVFVFFHEVLWLGSERYDGLQANFGDDPAYRDTRFWPEVYPLFQRFPGPEFYVLAGDVGGRPGAMPAFFDRVGNVTLVASGMGEVEDENFLRVQVGGKVTMTVVPLQEGKPVRPVEWFNPYNLRYRLAGQCVHPGCVLPQEAGEAGPAAAGTSLWSRLLQALGIQ
jgi:3',5'-cyclic AMP phosphodiesterase CpdA